MTIAMSDKMHFLPSVLTIRKGETVRFVVRNEGKLLHELVLGTEEELKRHADLTPNSAASEAIFSAIHNLSPKNETQSALKAQAASLAVDLGQLRMLLLAQMVPSVPRPLMISVMVWLGIIFLGFSLLAPPNATTALSLTAAAFSVAAAVFLIMEFDQPFSGSIRISSEPMRAAFNRCIVDNSADAAMLLPTFGWRTPGSMSPGDRRALSSLLKAREAYVGAVLICKINSVAGLAAKSVILNAPTTAPPNGWLAVAGAFNQIRPGDRFVAEQPGGIYIGEGTVERVTTYTNEGAAVTVLISHDMASQAPTASDYLSFHNITRSAQAILVSSRDASAFGA